ncbi:hypothetical protein COO60DRAFT_774987 [Scenedesmus sp. NREL 46B-D3]|nr:hypothetical protein COO60DRAFT_774987 [Scenedesmus sp. NREL 46B-D3]
MVQHAAASSGTASCSAPLHRWHVVVAWALVSQPSRHSCGLRCLSGCCGCWGGSRVVAAEHPWVPHSCRFWSKSAPAKLRCWASAVQPCEDGRPWQSNVSLQRRPALLSRMPEVQPWRSQVTERLPHSPAIRRSSWRSSLCCLASGGFYFIEQV